MSNRVLLIILNLSSLLSIVIFFLYKGYGWPLGQQGVEAIGAILIYIATTVCFGAYTQKFPNHILQRKGVKLGLLVGLLWTTEICMNNLLRPGLPIRDQYDDIFWVIIALVIAVSSMRYAYSANKLSSGIQIGLWSGLASGAIASITALSFIVFGMNQLLLDPLNLAEWSVVGKTSGTPTIAIYFAYQTLAGAVLHLIGLGLLMGLVLGVFGGVLGKSVRLVLKTKRTREDK